MQQVGLLERSLGTVVVFATVTASVVIVVAERGTAPSIILSVPVAWAFRLAFRFVVPTLIAYFLLRAFLSMKSLSLLLQSAAGLVFGASEIVGFGVGSMVGGANFGPTVSNLGALASSLILSVVGTLLLMFKETTFLPARRWIPIATGVLSLGYVAAVSSATLAGITPVLEVSKGPTSTGFFVLEVASLLFFFCGVGMLGNHSIYGFHHTYWYGLAMILLASSEVWLLLARGPADIYSWVSVASAAISMGYLVIAALFAKRYVISLKKPAQSEWPRA